MLKKITGWLLAITLLAMTSAQPALAKTKEEKEAAFAAKVKAGIAKLGAGADTRVEIKLRDKTKLKGFISEVGAESFVVTDPKTSTATTVTYPQVAKAKGNNLSTGAAIAIGVAIGVGATVLTILILIATLD